MTEARLRVVSANADGLRDPERLAEELRPWAADVVVLQDAPWRLRWRTPVASFANALGLFYAGGGKESVGNVVLVRQRIAAGEVRALRFPLVRGRIMRGAVLVRCVVAGVPFVVAGARLADDPVERAAQRSVLAGEVGDLTEPLLLCGDQIAGGDLSTLVNAADDAIDRGAILTGAGVRVTGFHLGATSRAGFTPMAADVTVASP